VIGGACDTYWGKTTNNDLTGRLKVRDQFEDPGFDGRII
jgi:hypothetical protein